MGIIIFILSMRSCSYKNETDMVLAEYKQENNYLKVYSSQRISALTKENKELRDKVTNLENVETAVEIKYVYVMNWDTVFVDSSSMKKDGIYHFEENDDTVRYNLDIMGDNIKWYKLDFKINDKLTLIQQNDGDLNKLTVQPNSSHMDITDVNAWHREDKSQKWYNKFTVGPQLGFGYGIINNKPDIFVGIAVGYDISKKK